MFRERRKEKERERNINVWLPLTCPQLGTWHAIQACALTGNWTVNPLVQGQALSPLRHTSQGQKIFVLILIQEKEPGFPIQLEEYDEPSSSKFNSGT